MSARARACVCMCLCVCVCVCVCVCTRAGGRRGRAPIRRYSSIRSLSFQPPETPPAHHARSMGLRSHLEAKARHAGPVALNGGFAVGDGIGGLGEEHALVAGRLFVLAHAAGLLRAASVVFASVFRPRRSGRAGWAQADLGLGSGIRGRGGGLRLGLGGQGSCWGGRIGQTAGTGLRVEDFFFIFTHASRRIARPWRLWTIGLWSRKINRERGKKKDVVVCAMMRCDDRR